MTGRTDMFMRGTDMHVERRFYDLGVDVFILQWAPDGVSRAHATKIEFEVHKEGAVLEPTLRLSEADAQRLFEELWAQGFRPSRPEHEAGKLAATQAHLQDMRAIVADKLKVELP